jgi:hypothetical protein
MARSVYVTGMEPGTGKSAIMLVLMDVLSRCAGRVGFFGPLIPFPTEPGHRALLRCRQGIGRIRRQRRDQIALVSSVNAATRRCAVRDRL